MLLKLIPLLFALNSQAAVSVGPNVSIGVVPITGGTFTGNVTIKPGQLGVGDSPGTQSTGDIGRVWVIDEGATTGYEGLNVMLNAVGATYNVGAPGTYAGIFTSGLAASTGGVVFIGRKNAGNDLEIGGTLGTANFTVTDAGAFTASAASTITTSSGVSLGITGVRSSAQNMFTISDGTNTLIFRNDDDTLGSTYNSIVSSQSITIRVSGNLVFGGGTTPSFDFQDTSNHSLVKITGSSTQPFSGLTIASGVASGANTGFTLNASNGPNTLVSIQSAATPEAVISKSGILTTYAGLSTAGIGVSTVLAANATPVASSGAGAQATVITSLGTGLGTGLYEVWVEISAVTNNDTVTATVAYKDQTTGGTVTLTPISSVALTAPTSTSVGVMVPATTGTAITVTLTLSSHNTTAANAAIVRLI